MSVLTDALLHLNKEQIMRSMNRWNNSLMLAAIMAAATVVACKPITAEAKPRGGASFSRPSVKPSAPPTPQPKVINRTTNNTTVIRETRVINGGGSSAPGIGSTILGTAAGSAIGTTAGVMLGNALSKPDTPPAAAPAPVEQHAPQCDPRYFDCTPKK